MSGEELLEDAHWEDAAKAMHMADVVARGEAGLLTRAIKRISK